MKKPGPTFKIDTMGAPEEQVIQLTRKQIEQMAQMADQFKDINDFQLRITNTSGIGQTMHFTFDLDLTDASKR